MHSCTKAASSRSPCIIPAGNEFRRDEEAGEGKDDHGRGGDEHVDGELLDAPLEHHPKTKSCSWLLGASNVFHARSIL